MHRVDGHYQQIPIAYKIYIWQVTSHFRFATGLLIRCFLARQVAKTLVALRGGISMKEFTFPKRTCIISGVASLVIKGKGLVGGFRLLDSRLGF